MISFPPPFTDSCLDRICGPYEQCVEDAGGVASCVCQECDGGRGEDDADAASEATGAEDERVCGSDGISYFSLCHLQRASCTQGGQDIEALHRGPCGECGQYNPSKSLMTGSRVVIDVV